MTSKKDFLEWVGTNLGVAALVIATYISSSPASALRLGILFFLVLLGLLLMRVKRHHFD